MGEFIKLNLTKTEIANILFPENRDALENSKCPVCGGVVNIKDFQDYLSIKEFKISGLCQDCQDKTFMG